MGGHDLELGVLYLADRQFEKARDALDRVPSTSPGYPMALFKRAQVSVLLHEPDAVGDGWDYVLGSVEPVRNDDGEVRVVGQRRERRGRPNASGDDRIGIARHDAGAAPGKGTRSARTNAPGPCSPTSWVSTPAPA